MVDPPGERKEAVVTDVTNLSEKTRSIDWSKSLEVMVVNRLR